MRSYRLRLYRMPHFFRENYIKWRVYCFCGNHFSSSCFYNTTNYQKKYASECKPTAAFTKIDASEMLFVSAHTINGLMGIFVQLDFYPIPHILVMKSTSVEMYQCLLKSILRSMHRSAVQLNHLLRLILVVYSMELDVPNRDLGALGNPTKSKGK